MHVKKGMVRLQGKKENEYKFEPKRKEKRQTRERPENPKSNFLKIHDYACYL